MNEKMIMIGGLVIILVIFYVILKLCSKFRKKVYQLFIKAEKNIESGLKMDYVVENIYRYLPTPVRVFVSKKVLRWILQKMFDVIKDFLHDGKIDGKEG